MKKKYHIGMVHFTLPPAISGVEMIVRDHARLLDDRGFKIHLLGSRGSSFRKSIELEIARSFDPKSNRVTQIQTQLAKKTIPPDFEKLKTHYVDIITKWLRTNGIQTVIVHNVLSRHYNLALTAALVEVARDTQKDIVWIAWIHDASFIDTKYTNLSPSLTHQYPWNLISSPQKPFQYVTVSNTRKSELMKMYGTPQSRIKVVKNGLDINKMLPLPLQTRELFKHVSMRKPDYVGIIPVRIVERKNIEFAITFAKIAQQQFGKKFIFIVTGAVHQQNKFAVRYYAFLKDRIKKERLQEHFIFLNEFVLKNHRPFNIFGVNVRDLYLISDFLFLPSTGEGFGLPVIEAGFMRIPIFCSNLDVFTEVGNGYIYSFDLMKKPKEIVEYVLYHLKRRKSTLFRKKVLQEYDFETIVDRDIIPLLKSS